MPRGSRRRRGATLVELVVVLTITSVLAGGMAVFLTRPMEAYVDLARRAALVDAAEGALRRIARDVRRALPNSLRVAAGGTALEMLHAVEGIKYRREPPREWLGFGAGGDTLWNVLGTFRALSFGYGTPLPAGTRIAVYPTGAGVYADAALGSNPGTITPAGTAITILADADEDRVQLSAPFQFAFESPQQRLFVVDGPISYLCVPAGGGAGGAGTLTRYDGYAIAQLQPTLPSVAPLAGASSALVSKRVSACAFTWQPGTPQRTGVLTVELSVSEGPERIRLLHQIHVENAP